MATRYSGPGAKGTLGAMVGDATDVNEPKYVPKRRSRKGGINLKAVAEVLAERGLDPTEEIIDVLDEVDDKGKPLLDADTRARINLELLQYVQPKLKSVEIKAKVATMGFDVNDDQAKRIAEAFLKGVEQAEDEALK